MRVTARTWPPDSRQASTSPAAVVLPSGAEMVVTEGEPPHMELETTSPSGDGSRQTVLFCPRKSTVCTGKSPRQLCAK